MLCIKFWKSFQNNIVRDNAKLQIHIAIVKLES